MLTGNYLIICTIGLILIEFPVEVQTDLVYDKSQLIIIRNHRLIFEYISHTIPQQVIIDYCSDNDAQ